MPVYLPKFRKLPSWASTSVKHKDEGQEEDPGDLTKLNDALRRLRCLFPDVLPEVLREMLRAFDGETRNECIANELLSRPEKWIKGRCYVPDAVIKDLYATPEPRTRASLTQAYGFRTESYRSAVRTELGREYYKLSDSTIDAVLAEQNHHYGSSRRALQAVSAQRPLAVIRRFFSKSRNPVHNAPQLHPNIQWIEQSGSHDLYPLLRNTSSAELNQELYDTILEPLLRESLNRQIYSDKELCWSLSRAEASATGSFIECQCCFGEDIFERMAFCTEAEHATCCDCLARTLKEVLYGQGWDQMVDQDRGVLRCCAMGISKPCCGNFAPGLVHHVLMDSNDNSELWKHYEKRLLNHWAQRSGLSLVRCPSCSYAEGSDLYIPPPGLRYTVRFRRIGKSFPLLLTAVLAVVLALPYFLLNVLCPSVLTHYRVIILRSLFRLKQATLRPQRFLCKSPKCGFASCLVCCKEWRDPHSCDPPADQSLRIAIEAARTTAIKRTCPQCGLGFIKESGCNKLVCRCGYVMCYVCRQGLNAKIQGGSYGHFCQHFRPHGGHCTECDRCDLYRGIDDEEAVQLAGQLAEREWKQRQQPSKQPNRRPHGAETRAKDEVSNEWSLQSFFDWFITESLTC